MIKSGKIPNMFRRGGGIPLGSISLTDASTYMVSDSASLLNEQIKGTTQKFSISIWLKLNWYDGQYQTIFSRDNNSGGRQFACEFDDVGRWTFFIADDGTKYSWWKSDGAFIRTNGWYNLIQTFDNTQSLADKCKIYINGTEIATTRVDVGGGVSDVNDQPLEPIYIGVTNFGGLINPSNCNLSRITFYNDILTSGDASLIYNNGLLFNELSGLSINPYMMWNMGSAIDSGDVTVNDLVGTSYPSSKSFTSVGSVAVSNSTYPTPLVYQPETTALISEMTGSPTQYEQDYIDDLINGLLTDGNWDIADLVRVYASHDSNDALLNWVSPVAGSASLVNSPSFTVGVGFTGNSAASRHINENINPTLLSNYSLNSGAVFVYCELDINAAEAVFGNGNGTDLTVIIPRNGGSFAGRINSDTNTLYANGSSIGLMGVIRLDSNSQNINVNGVNVQSGVVSSTNIANNNFYTLAYNNNGAAALFSNNTVRFVYVSNGTVDAGKLYRRIFNFLLSK